MSVCAALDCDVLVAGGGPAGVTAAIAAARCGSRVCLIERDASLGGENQGALFVHGFFDAAGRKVVGGVADDIIALTKQYGGVAEGLRIVNHPWIPNIVAVDGELYRLATLEAVLSAGVQVVLNAAVDDVLLAGRRVRGVFVRTRGGRQLILCRYLVDASGDASVAVAAGAQSAFGRASDGQTQPMTLLFTLGGVDPDVLVKEGAAHAWARLPGRAGEDLVWLATDLTRWREGLQTAGLPPVWLWANSLHPGIWNINVTSISGLNPLDASDLSRAEVLARQQMMRFVTFLRAQVPGFGDAFLLKTAPRVGIRETRRIVGDYVLHEGDITSGAEFSDVVALCGFNVAVLDPVHGRLGDEVVNSPRGHYDIPYRCLLPLGLDNVLVAGRSISVTHEALGSTRMQGTCMALGHAAGVAAALASSGEESLRGVSISSVQDHLRRDGAILRLS